MELLYSKLRYNRELFNILADAHCFSEHTIFSSSYLSIFLIVHLHDNIFTTTLFDFVGI